MIVVNPYSVRNFKEYKIIKISDKYVCESERATEFLNTILIYDDTGVSGKFDYPILISGDNIIVDGNIRYHLSQQLKVLDPSYTDNLRLESVRTTEPEKFFKQLNNTVNKVPLSKKFKLIREFISTYDGDNVDEAIKQYSTSFYQTYKLLKRYEALPAWLKNEVDKFEINPNVAIHFYTRFNDSPVYWEAVIIDALKTSVNEFRVTKRNVDAIPISEDESVIEPSDDTEGVEEPIDYKPIAADLIEKLKVTLSSFDIEKYECADWKRFVKLLDTVHYAISGK